MTMTLYERLLAMHPDLTDADFDLFGTIRLQNDSDGRGDYIAAWNHPTISQPTPKQLQEIES